MTEDEYVEQVLLHGAAARIMEAEAGLGHAERVGAGAWPNPTLNWQREAVPGAGGSSQDILFASVPLVLSGRLGLEQEAADQRAQAAEARAARSAAELHYAAVRAFQTVVIAHERRAAFEASLSQLDILARTIAVRERAGEASGYDTLRIDLERASLAGELSGVGIEEQRATADAQRLLGPTATTLPPLVGPLQTDRPMPRLGVLLAGLERDRADVRALALEALAAGAARRAADRSWIPEPTLNAGVQWLDGDDGSNTGYYLGVALPLPLFEHRQGEYARSAATATLAQARRAALVHDARSRLSSGFATLELRRRQLLRHEADVMAKTQELQRIAAAAYRGGASELLVLVDAERAARDARLRRVELTSSLVEAENDLLFLSGAYDAGHPRRTAP
jgi:cobalt-zinc-cadmium efflux system outer membrane protein